MGVIRRPCDCCGGGSESGCDHCCDEGTLPAELTVTVPGGWIDGGGGLCGTAVCDDCGALAGDWTAAFVEATPVGDSCPVDFFDDNTCAEYESTYFLCNKTAASTCSGTYELTVRVRFLCETPGAGQCQLKVQLILTEVETAGVDCCPPSNTHTYLKTLSTSDCKALNETVNYSSSDTTNICDNPPATVTVAA